MADVVAVDLGGTNIRVSRVSSDGKIIARDKIPTLAKEGGMAAVMERVAGLIKKVRGPETIAVGVGTPGVPDWETGEMLLPAVNIPNSGGFPLSATLSKATGLPVFADNDGNLAALAETWLGSGVGEPFVLIFTLGTGIGGGLVINGETYHGIKNLGTEFGHCSIAFDGRKCGCGNTGCVELYASASALGRDARDAVRNPPKEYSPNALLKMCEGNIDKVDARMVCECARENDPLACFLLDRCCLWLSCGVGSMINALNPSCVILGGGMALAGELLRSRVEKNLNEGRAFGPIWKTCKLRMAKLGDDAGLLGAARMAFQRAHSRSKRNAEE
jgi:glucokinase